MDEIRCDGCGTRFDGDSLVAASRARWLISDAVLCPCCADEWEKTVALAPNADTYGRHHSTFVNRHPFWRRIRAWNDELDLPPWDRYPTGAHRLTETRRMTIAELRLAVTG